MAGVRFDQTTLATLERFIAPLLEGSAAVLVMVQTQIPCARSLKVLRPCLASVGGILQQRNDLLAHQPAAPDDDAPAVVRLDAEVRALADALRERADGLAMDLTREIRKARARRRAPKTPYPGDEVRPASW